MNLQDLKQIAVLKGLEDEVLTRLGPALEEKRLADAEQLFAEGDPGDGMYFIAEGSIRIEKATDASKANRKTLAVLEAGDYFGEMSLIERRPRSTSTVASGAGLVLRLTPEAFERLMRESSDTVLRLLFGMIRTSSERIRRLNASVVVYDEIGKAIGEAKSLQQLLDVVLHQLAHASRAEWALLLLKPQFSDRLEVRAAENISLTQAHKAELAEGKGVLSLVVRSRKEQLIRNLPAEEPFRLCRTIGFETPSMVLAPILLGQDLLGVIFLGHPDLARFDLNDLNLAEGVARQAAQAILNARHKEEDQARAKLERRIVRF
jgi:CRP-like cAMP-binding protein